MTLHKPVLRSFVSAKGGSVEAVTRGDDGASGLVDDQSASSDGGTNVGLFHSLRSFTLAVG